MVYRRIVKPVLFAMDPERIHKQALVLGKAAGTTPVTRAALKVAFYYEHPSLVQQVKGITFKNPMGLAAGFDKDCQLMHVLPSLGFGYEEVGSITAEPYAGNKGRWITRLPKDQSIIVNYGLKNKGATVIRKKFIKHGQPRQFKIPIGISIAKTNKEFNTIEEKIADWVDALRLLKDCGDYITINVSCPNTYDPTNFADPNLLSRLLRVTEKAGVTFHKPVFIKLGADISTKQLDDIIAVCDQHNWISGFILSNLVKDRTKIQFVSQKEEYEHQKGGISGRPVMPYALNLVRHAYKTAGDRYIIIGCGGIFTADDAYAYIRSGATLLQLITGMIYNGPATVKRINQGLVKLLERDGYKHLSEAVGADLKANDKSSS